MSCQPPRLKEADALAAAWQLFGVAADAAVSLGSERDQAWLLSAGGSNVAVIKVSNAREVRASMLSSRNLIP